MEIYACQMWRMDKTNGEGKKKTEETSSSQLPTITFFFYLHYFFDAILRYTTVIFLFQFLFFFVPQNWHTSLGWTNVCFEYTIIIIIVTQHRMVSTLHVHCCSSSISMYDAAEEHHCMIQFFLAHDSRILEWLWMHSKSHLFIYTMCVLVWIRMHFIYFKPIKCFAKC